MLGLPLYNFGAPSTVKAWVDHIVAQGLSIDAETGEGLLGGTDFVALSSRGGGYGPGTPREGWDHAQAWLPHSVSLTGLEPRIITAELTMADVNPAMAELRPLAAESLSGALRAIDELWADEYAASAAPSTTSGAAHPGPRIRLVRKGLRRVCALVAEASRCSPPRSIPPSRARTSRN